MLLFSGALWCICLQQFFRSGANRFADLWFPTYLQESRHIGKEIANQLASIPLWGGVIGGTIGGLLSDFLLCARAAGALPVRVWPAPAWSAP